MATGYEDSRFDKKVDDNLHCVICMEVLKDPVQCPRNEHHFCKNCITEHLKHAQNCPTCRDPLTVETLAKPQRFLASTLASLKISCDNSERGCRALVELGSLNTHVASCGFSPVPCSNDQCDEIISRRDKEIHESKACDFRTVKCDYCAESLLHKDYIQHACPPMKEIREIKTELRKVCSTQDEILRMMKAMMGNRNGTERNTFQDFEQRSQGSDAGSYKDLQFNIIVAGGLARKSAEVFNMATKTWWPLSKMKIIRGGASSILYKERMIMVGGYGSDRSQDSLEELRVGHLDLPWIECQFKIPVPSYGHACVVYQDHLFVVGGSSGNVAFDTIREIQLSPPYTSRIVARMSEPRCFHSAEVVNDKIYIIGGSTTTDCEHASNTVFRFDPLTAACTQLKPLPYPVSSMATTTWKENVVVLGGLDKKSNARSTAILYDVTNGSHRMLSAMRRSRYGCTAVIIGHTLMTMGGNDAIRSALNSVECYNFNTNTWTEFPPMLEERVYHNAVVKYC